MSSTASGSRITIPSSVHIAEAARSSRSRRASIASAHGACTREPNGVRMHTRQSPISSGKRSTTIVRSSGTAPVASAWSSRYASRFLRARSSRPSAVSSASASARASRAARAPSCRGRGRARAAGPACRPSRTASSPAARGGRDDDAVVRDLLDAPGRRAEQERLAGARLVDHLLVELADAAAVGEEHAEEAAVGDRAAARDREALRPLASLQPALDAVPHDAGPQARELVGRVAAREHVEHRLERVARQVGEVRAAPDEREEVVDRPVVDRARRDDLLREHVEWAARVAHLLDEALRASGGRPPSPRAGRRATSGRSCRCSARRRGGRPARPAASRATEPGDSTSTTRSTVPMSMPSSSDDVATSPRRRPDFSSSSTSRCSRASEPWCAHELFARELVEPRREPFGEPPRVGEHERGAVRADQLEQAGAARAARCSCASGAESPSVVTPAGSGP